MFSMSEGLDLVSVANERAGYNRRIKFAIDVAANDFCVHYLCRDYVNVQKLTL